MLVVVGIGYFVDLFTVQADVAVAVAPVVAGEAFERLFAGVNAHVFGQFGINQELLAAVRTAEVAFLLVDAHHVVFEPVGATKDFAAQIAHVVGLDIRFDAVDFCKKREREL